MRLADAQLRVPEHDFAGSIIHRTVREGFEPFRGKMVSIWMDFDIDTNMYVISAAVCLMNGYTISFSSSPISSFDLADSPVLAAEIIGNQLRDKFWHREVIRPIPETIILGEN